MYNLRKEGNKDGGKNMSIGHKIRNIRLKRNMTQKELGLAIGFSERTADVRIAQYESGTRVPKNAVLFNIATALNANSEYMMAPSIDLDEEIIHALIYLDELNLLKMEADGFKNIEGEDQKKIKINIGFLDYYLEEWYIKKRALENNEITQEEYYEWKINWPDSSERYKKIFSERFDK